MFCKSNLQKYIFFSETVKYNVLGDVFILTCFHIEK